MQTGINPWSTTPEAGMLTITPQMRHKGAKLSIVAPLNVHFNSPAKFREAKHLKMGLHVYPRTVREIVL